MNHSHQKSKVINHAASFTTLWRLNCFTNNRASALLGSTKCDSFSRLGTKTAIPRQQLRLSAAGRVTVLGPETITPPPGARSAAQPAEKNGDKTDAETSAAVDLGASDHRPRGGCDPDSIGRSRPSRMMDAKSSQNERVKAARHGCYRR